MPELDPDDDGQRETTTAQFAKELRQLRALAGNPSFRRMAGRSGRISHTTLHEAATGNRFPSWETTREYIHACGGDETQWRARWERCAQAGPLRPASRPVAEVEPAGGHGPTAEPGPAAPLPLRSPRRVLTVAGALILLAVLSGTALALRPEDRTTAEPGPETAHPTVPLPPAPRISGDHSRFITDVTVPDGTTVTTGMTFVKVWEIENSGTVPWYGRHLQREDSPAAPDDCQTPHRIPISNTLPNERVKISVTVTARSTPGDCMVRWKMVDDQGELFFPSSRPVFFLVRVVATD
ncbi:NBR1-Ig-like domain-containing protein [Solwaraspora sp. WMMB762]|uniref:NBR1-Ig-like domain-containing protein n=1 Tax=Solwaraspora sp. WMMB762 TaxID=3404120 RepID=UPI003B95903B